MVLAILFLSKSLVLWYDDLSGHILLPEVALCLTPLPPLPHRSSPVLSGSCAFPGRIPGPCWSRCFAPKTGKARLSKFPGQWCWAICWTVRAVCWTTCCASISPGRTATPARTAPSSTVTAPPWCSARGSGLCSPPGHGRPGAGSSPSGPFSTGGWISFRRRPSSTSSTRRPPRPLATLWARSPAASAQALQNHQ